MNDTGGSKDHAHVTSHLPSWLTVTAKAAVGLAMLATGSGCGALTAITNPKAAWALVEPAPMAIILRRGDAARATATNVDRLMGGTPIDATSRWATKLLVKKADVEASLKSVRSDPDYTGSGAKIRVVHAEAWAKVLSDVCPHETKYTSLLASVGPEVESAYGEVTAKAELLSSLKASRDDEQGAIDDANVSEADKEEHRKKKQEIEAQIGSTESDRRAKLDAFLLKLRDDVGKAPADVKKQMPVVLVALKRAIDDAKLANSVAILRYPLAMPRMPEELKTQAKRIVADAVQDKTGHRPDLDKAEPQVSFADGEVHFTLAGMPPEASGGLKPAALLTDVVGRTESYVERVLTFTSYVAETQDLLDLETEIVKVAMDGLEVDETKVAAGEDLSEVDVAFEPTPAGAKGKLAVARHPVPMLPCGKVEPKDAEEDSDDAEGGGGDDKDPKTKKKGSKVAKKHSKARRHHALSHAKTNMARTAPARSVASRHR